MRTGAAGLLPGLGTAVRKAQGLGRELLREHTCYTDTFMTSKCPVPRLFILNDSSYSYKV